jgi:hypothetical protein
VSDGSHLTRNLRERLGSGAEDRVGRALSDLLDNPLLTGAIGRAFDAREKAQQAQEVALGALNLPSASDIERLTRRLRSVSLRLEGIEDRLDRALSGVQRQQSPPTRDGDLSERLAAIEDQLERLAAKVPDQAKPAKPSRAAKPKKAPARGRKA